MGKKRKTGRKDRDQQDFALINGSPEGGQASRLITEESAQVWLNARGKKQRNARTPREKSATKRKT